METNSGMWLDRTLRIGACGTWWSAGTAGGQALGMLQVAPALVAQPGARERVATAIAAVRAANPPGVLRTTELVVDTRQAWLVVATLPKPTLADLLAAHATLPPGAAAGLAVDMASALRELHAVGLGHGDLTADTVVLTGAGAATLAEVGVLAAAHDTPTDIGRDTVAWSVLARELAAVATAPEADLLRHAAATAESGDLTTATRTLAAAAVELPDFAARNDLAAMLPTLGPAPARVPAQRSTTEPSKMDATSEAVQVPVDRGVPPSAVVAAPAAAAPPRRNRRARRLVWALAWMSVLLLGGGAAVWWYMLG